MDKYLVKLHMDIDRMNPFTDWECEWPVVWQTGQCKEDYSNGWIDYFLSGYLTYNQLIRHQRKIADMIDFDIDWYKEAGYTSDERIDELSYALNKYVSESNENREEFCLMFGIKHARLGLTGYSQGDYVDVFTCWNPKTAKSLGVDYKDVSVDTLEHTCRLLGYWMFGNVYGYEIIDDASGECVDSCYGFYGERDVIAEQMVDSIPYESYGWTRQQCIDRINDAELIY